MKRIIILVILILVSFNGCSDKGVQDNKDHFAKEFEMQVLKKSLKKYKLEPGKQEGSFLFQYKDKIAWVGQECFPTFLTLKKEGDNGFKVEFEKKIVSGDFFNFDIELFPGTYVLQSRIISDKCKQIYDDCLGATITLDSEGMVQVFDLGFTHRKRLRILRPKFISTIKSKFPIIEWSSVSGITQYKIKIEITPKDSEIPANDIREFKIKETSLTLKKVIPNHSQVVVFIDALDAKGEIIALQSTTFYIKY